LGLNNSNELITMHHPTRNVLTVGLSNDNTHINSNKLIASAEWRKG